MSTTMQDAVNLSARCEGWKELTANEMHVLRVLASYVGKEGRCNPGLRRLEQDLHMRYTSIARLISSLEKKGALVISRDVAFWNTKKPSSYTIVLPEKITVSSSNRTVSEEGVKQSLKGGMNSLPRETESKTISLRHKSTTAEESHTPSAPATSAESTTNNAVVRDTKDKVTTSFTKVQTRSPNKDCERDTRDMRSQEIKDKYPEEEIIAWTIKHRGKDWLERNGRPLTREDVIYHRNSRTVSGYWFWPEEWHPGDTSIEMPSWVKRVEHQVEKAFG